MVFMVIIAVIAAVSAVIFLIKTKACKGDIAANVILILIALACSILGIADKQNVKKLSESYDVLGSDFLEQYDYCGIEGDYYTFKKKVFTKSEGDFAGRTDNMELPSITRIYKPVRFVCKKGSPFSVVMVQPFEKGTFYAEINPDSIVRVIPQPQAAVITGFIVSLAGLLIYDISRLFVKGFKNGMDAYDDHIGKDKVE